MGKGMGLADGCCLGWTSPDDGMDLGWNIDFSLAIRFVYRFPNGKSRTGEERS